MRSRKAKKKTAAEPPGDAEPAQEETTTELSDPPGKGPDEAADGIAVAEAAEPVAAEQPVEAEAVPAELKAQLDELQDRYLRLAAEYDNFRKRTARERGQITALAQAELARCMLDALDDLGRVVGVDPENASAKDIITGVELVERKMLRELESAGLERIGEAGETFDPNHHEAVGSMPATAPEEDHTVGEVLQSGYRFGGLLLRPTKVRVRMWQGESDTAEG